MVDEGTACAAVIPLSIDMVATGSYHCFMKPIKTVGIKELKNNLSAYLREVRNGYSVLISDRNDVVAELHEPYGQSNIAGGTHPLLLAWAQEGLVQLPKREKQPLQPSPIQRPEGTGLNLLSEDRKESGE